MMIKPFFLVIASLLTSWGNAFVVRQPQSYKTQLYLEDEIADMIDRELWRQGHKKEYEIEWMEKNRAAVVQSFDDSNISMFNDDNEAKDFRQRVKDEKMAQKNPQRYCADRCISTGNCDVYEDMYVYYWFGPWTTQSFSYLLLFHQLWIITGTSDWIL